MCPTKADWLTLPAEANSSGIHMGCFPAVLLPRGLSFPSLLRHRLVEALLRMEFGDRFQAQHSSLRRPRNAGGVCSIMAPRDKVWSRITPKLTPRTASRTPGHGTQSGLDTGLPYRPTEHRWRGVRHPTLSAVNGMRRGAEVTVQTVRYKTC